MKKYLLFFLALLLFSGSVEAAGVKRKQASGVVGANGANGAVGAQGPGYKCYGGLAASLIAGGTDFASQEATTTANGLIPYLVRAFDGSTTEYMRGSILLEPNLKLISNATFYATVRPKTSAASKNVQLMFQSTATATGGPVNSLIISTGADIVSLSAVMHQWTVSSWSQTISNLGWAPSNIVEFGFSRAHDTSKLGATELSGDLYWEDWKLCVDLQ